MRVACIVLSVLMLTGCAARQAAEVQSMVVGRSKADIEECMGLPTHTEKLANSTVIEEWDYSESTVGAQLPLSTLALLPISLPMALAGQVSVSGAGNCKTIVTLNDDRVQQLVYAGASDGISGRNAVCAAVVRGCLRLWIRKGATHGVK